ncbi:hypothetical protein CPB85DRAFT_1252617 [Mucidula mucida]|nr:hypothetical protein CPB85DRAFT_1252617 [Mucidula mucida]
MVPNTDANHLHKYLNLAIAFTASNAPEAVPEVYKFVAQNLQLALAGKLHNGLFKSGMICGFPKQIRIELTAQLHTVILKRFRDAEPLRQPLLPPISTNTVKKYFNQTYGHWRDGQHGTTLSQGDQPRFRYMVVHPLRTSSLANMLRKEFFFTMFAYDFDNELETTRKYYETRVERH